MASSREYLEFVLEQLSKIENISYKPMMGEYILYCNGKIFGGVYDDRFLIKITNNSTEYMKESTLAVPYPTAKPMYLVENIDDKDFLKEVIESMLKDLK